MIGRRAFIVCSGAAVTLFHLVRAQGQGTRPHLIAFQTRRDDVRAQMFLSEMAVLGYVEGRDFALEYFGGEGAIPDPEYSRIVSLAPAVIVPNASGATARFAQLTATIPLITAGLTVETAAALIGPNYGRPMGNVTGTVSASDGLTLKLLQLAQELVYGAATVGLVSNVQREAEFRSAVGVAKRDLNLNVVLVVAPRDEDMAVTFAPFVRERVSIVVNPTAVLDNRILELMAHSKSLGIPVLCSRIENVEEGALFSYGPDQRYGYGRAAHFVDRLFKGASPADLPAEQVSEFRLAVNLTAARAWGFAVPPTILARADVVIE